MKKTALPDCELSPIDNIITPKIRRALVGPTPIQSRLIETASRCAQEQDDQSILFQHSVFCQTCLPNRDPGNDVRVWERLNGKTHLKVLAGEAMHPEKERLVEVGLPFGPKSRMILMHINQRALITKSPSIEVEGTLTKFVGRMLKLDSGGRTLNTVKDQLARLAAASIRVGVVRDGHAYTFKSNIVEAFDLWFPKDERQRVLWPSTVSLSLDYFHNLMEHAVPVEEGHIAALSHSSLALDIYSWLAQRLHRIPAEKPQIVSWLALHAQFGQGYNLENMSGFRRSFRTALAEVLKVYRVARVEEEEATPVRRLAKDGEMLWREEPAKGLKLYNSPPPVRKLLK